MSAKEKQKASLETRRAKQESSRNSSRRQESARKSSSHLVEKKEEQAKGDKSSDSEAKASRGMQITITGDGEEGLRVVDRVEGQDKGGDAKGQDTKGGDAKVLDNHGGGGIKCPHCKLCPTNPVDYKSHLESTVHDKAMKSCMFGLNLHLRNMRSTQRNQQKEADKGIECEDKQYCKTCALIYKQSKTDHNQSEYHKKIKM